MTYTKDKIGAMNLAKVDKISTDIKSGKNQGSDNG